MKKDTITAIAKLEEEQKYLFKKVDQLEAKIQDNEQKLILLKASRELK